jgi:hypothetical protein
MARSSTAKFAPTQVGSPNAAIRDPRPCSWLIDSLRAPDARTKLAASKGLRDLSRREPARVYAHFDDVALLLTHQNNILKWNAILTLAHLARVDEERKLDRILDAYLAPITGPVMITAANTIKGAALIAQARPDLASPIVASLLRVEKAVYASPECRNVAIGHVLTAFAKLSRLVPDTRRIRLFAARHIRNPRAATAAKARSLAASSALASKPRSRS